MVMPTSPNKPSDKPVFSLARYAGLGTQIIAGLLITLYFGKKADAYFNWHNRAAWILPSLFILSTLILVVRDTQKNK
jgi:uncharacterized membrane protein